MYVDGRGFQIFGYFVNWYGVIIAFGMVLGVLLGSKLIKKRGFKSETIIDIALVCIPSAIIGARLYYCIFYTHNYSFAEFFKIWEGGLAIYGGVIGGVIGLSIYCIVKKINFFKIADCLVPCLILGQAIGRWGNFTNHEAYGNLITNSNFQFFPFGVLIESSNYTSLARDAVINAYGSLEPTAWFMATFFYESMWNFMVLVVLLIIFNKSQLRGLTTCGYFVLYGIGRFWIEGLRMDSLYFLGLRVSQWLSLALVIGFGIYALYLITKEKKRGNHIFERKHKTVLAIGQNGSMQGEKMSNNAVAIGHNIEENGLKADEDINSQSNKKSR